LIKNYIKLVKTLLGSFLFLVVFFSSTSAAPDAPVIPVATPAPTTPAEPTSRLWNLQDADILSVINEVSLDTGKNFVVDPRVSGKITLVSSKPLKPGEVYNVFLSVLGLLGYSAIPNGNVIKIIPNMESGEAATRIASNQFPGKGDEVVVRVLPLEHTSATQLIPVIRPLLPQWSNVSVYMPGNILILLGRAANLERIVNIVKQIDQSADNQIEVVPLHRSSASQLTNVLNNLQNAGRATGETPQVSIAPDERSNSILLGGNKTARMHMRFLISQLDTPSNGAQGNTEVIYLRYLQAKDFAPILGKIAQNILGKGEKENAGAASATGTNNSATKELSTTESTMGPPTTPPTTTPATTLSYSSTDEKEKEIVTNSTNIQAEPSTNSLIITAPPALMVALKAIVAKLDIRPAQVLIEAIIVQIEQDDVKNLGIQWGGRITNNTIDTLNGSDGFTPVGIGTVGIIPSMQIKAVLTMLENQTGVDILSTPSVVVLDNQKAVLQVGQNIPEQSGSYATTGTTNTVTPFNTTVYTPVVLKLEVIPQLNLGNAIRLKINLQNDSLRDPDNPGPTPITNTSQITNSVIINSSDVLVLGGLISNDIRDNIDKIPFLGDIPFIGNAFQHHVRRLQKRNLMVFIKPVIIHNTEDANALTYSKYELARNSQVKWPEDLSNPGDQKLENILPRWRHNVKLPKPFE